MADHQLLSIHKFIVDSLKRIIAGIMFDAFDLLLFLLFLLNCWGVGSAILFIFIFIDNWNIVWRFCAIKCKNVTGLTFYSSWWALDFFLDGNFQQRQTGAQCTALHCSYIYASEIISFVDKMKKEEKKLMINSALELNLASVCSAQEASKPIGSSPINIKCIWSNRTDSYSNTRLYMCICDCSSFVSLLATCELNIKEEQMH